MHIVTKFLVIIAALLSVLLSGLTIAYSTNAQRLREAVDVEKQKAAAAEAARDESLAAQVRERESLEQERTALQAAMSQVRQTIAELQGDNAQLLTDKKTLELGQTRYNTQIDQFLALTDAMQKKDEARAAEADELRRKNLDLLQKEIVYLDRINDLTGQQEVASETIRSLQEQLAEIRQELDATRGGTAIVPGAIAQAGSKLAPRGFRARVLSVQRDSTGSVMVGIDAGSNAALEKDMKLNVVDLNGGRFLGVIVLERVDLNEAVGRITLLGSGAREPAPGDQVAATSS